MGTTPKKDLENLTPDDVAQLLSSNSDFSFEMRVAQVLEGQGYDVEHSGTYEDPVTKKFREFDIRAEKQWHNDNKPRFAVEMAVECKNVRDPIVAHCVKRSKDESLNAVVFRPRSLKYWEKKTTKVEGGGHPAQMIKRERVIPKGAAPLDRCRILNCSPSTVYPQNDWVAKSLDQLRYDGQNNLRLNDGDVFEKFSQAMSSLTDIIKIAPFLEDSKYEYFEAFLPIVVVPDRKLWAVRYNKSGKIEGSPELVDHVSFLQNRIQEIESSPGKDFIHFTSHLEVCTISGLPALLNRFFEDPYGNHSYFGDLDINYRQAMESIAKEDIH